MVTEDFETALHEREGIEQPSQVNPFLQKRKRRELTTDDYVNGILNGDRVILSRAITLAESLNPDHQRMAQEVIERCLPHSGHSLRIGITGVPGVGKSTFIEAFGKHLTSIGKKIAVLAIDPSSERSKGSILGDKTRMELLSTDPNAFIRPSPSGLTLGGVARKTRETIVLCEAAGFDIIIVETVGVGQSETVVKSMVDFFLLLMLAGAGDELQGIKRGIMEMADALVINKADGDNVHAAEVARTRYQSALHLFPMNENGWVVPVATCSAIEHTSIDKVWQIMCDFEQHTKANGFFEKNRNEQNVKIFYDWIDFTIKNNFFNNPDVQTKIDELLPKVLDGRITPYQAGNAVTMTED
jgi:LAO/AO transport system kinase